MSTIHLLTSQFPYPKSIKAVVGFIENNFPCSIQNTSGPDDVLPGFDQVRYQYDAFQIIRQVNSNLPGLIIVLCDVDLFIPIFTYVFGLATLNGKAAVVSGHRLHNRYYGLPENEAVFNERLTKEILHELGHLCGLRHCPDYSCVMCNSPTVDEIDLKTAVFCPNCYDQLQCCLAPNHPGH